MQRQGKNFLNKETRTLVARVLSKNDPLFHPDKNLPIRPALRDTFPYLKGKEKYIFILLCSVLFYHHHFLHITKSLSF